MPFNDIEKTQCSKHAKKCDEQETTTPRNMNFSKITPREDCHGTEKNDGLEGDFSFSRGVFSGFHVNLPGCRLSHSVLPNP